MGSRNMGSACGVYAIFMISIETWSSLLFGRTERKGR